MYMNYKMQKLVDKRLDQNLNVPDVKLIEKQCSFDGEDYYCLKEGFCFYNSKNIRSCGLELSMFEWDGNEIFISDPEIDCVINITIKTIRQLQQQMINHFSGISFDIFVSFDVEDIELPPSSTVRFYKIRENYHIITCDRLEEYDQPVGLCQVLNISDGPK